jgi:hypothetical protein
MIVNKRILQNYKPIISKKYSSNSFMIILLLFVKQKSPKNTLNLRFHFIFVYYDDIIQ